MSKAGDAPVSRALYFERISAEQYAFLVRVSVVILIFLSVSAVNPNFFTLFNVLSILRQSSILFVLASGATLVMIGGGIDLSVGAVISLAAAISAMILQATGSVALAMLGAVAVGAAIGSINGALVALLRLQPFLVTYGTLWVVSGAALWLMAGTPITGFPPAFRLIGGGFFLGVPVPVLIMVSVIVVGTTALTRTTFGRQLYMMGSNKTVAVLSGVPIVRNLFATYVLSGLGAACAAIILLGRVNSADPGMGDPYLLPSIAAILVGGTSLFGGVGTLAGTAVGAVLLTTVLAAMNMLLLPSAWQPFATGVALLLAVLVDAAMKRLRDA